MNFVFCVRPQPDLLPQEKEKLLAGFGFAADHLAIQSREFPSRRRTILLLLGEKAGLREVVNHLKSAIRMLYGKFTPCRK